MIPQTKTILEEECLKNNLDFEAVTRWQYAVCKSSTMQFPMEKLQVGQHHVFVGHGVTTVALLDRTGGQFGLLMGIAVSEDGPLVDSVTLASTDVSSSRFWSDFEKWLIPLAGRYTIVCDCAQGARIYNDPSGANGCVYSRERRVVASSPLLCIDRPPSAMDRYDAQRVKDGHEKYSLFHTCDSGVRRANPSFFLDLGTYTETRFWPRNEVFTVQKEGYWQVYEKLAELGRRTVSGINSRYKTVAALSGGQDSRLLLALAGPEISGFHTSFTHIHNYASRIDACISSEMSRRLQIRLEVFDKRKIPRDRKKIRRDNHEFSLGCGYAMPPHREMQMNLHVNLPDGAVILRGHQSDILRAVFIDKLGPKAREDFYWQIKRLLIVPAKKFDRSVYERFLPDYQKWRASVPERARLHTVDLMFLEVYYSSTIGASFPALSKNFFMSPFNSREFIQLAMSIGEGYRRKSHAVNDILMHLNPSLHDIPFDYEFGGKRPLDRIHNTNEMNDIVKERRDASIERRLARAT